MLKHHLSMSGFHLGSLARVWQKNLIIRYQMFWWQRCAWIIHITSELSPAWNRGATMTNKVTSRQDDESRILSGWPRRHFHLELGDAPLPQHKCHFVQYKFYPSGSAKKKWYWGETDGSKQRKSLFLRFLSSDTNIWLPGGFNRFIFGFLC